MSSEPATQQPVVMRQRWRDLLFLHWRLPASEVQAHLPAGLIVDEFDGWAYVGLVPFTMRDVAPSWFAPVPLVSDLLECNVRTYVRRADGSSPGVWFFSLDASGPIAVAAARTLFALPYYFAAMRQTERRVWNQSLGIDGGWSRQVKYECARRHPGAASGRCCIVYALSGGVAAPAEPGTLERFLLERYTLYAFRSDCLYAGQVHHQPYTGEAAQLLSMEESLLEAAGLTRPAKEPLVHYSREVVVRVSPLVRV